MIFIGSDHRGFLLKERLKKKIIVQDVGTYQQEACDYPLVVATMMNVFNTQNDVGILICGTCIGMCMAANRYHGIQALRPSCAQDVMIARAHNNANVVCVGEDESEDQIILYLQTLQKTPFEAGRHLKRVSLMNALGKR